MKRSQLAAQLYTLRDFLKTPADIAGSLEKVAKIGYQAIQVSGMGPIDESELCRIAADNHLTICATHESGKSILEEPAKVAERLNKLSCKYTAYPWPHIMPATANGVKAVAHQLNESAKIMADAGVVLCYHNHAIEFQKFDGELMLDIIYREAPALKSEIDTFWIQSGGGDPASWVRKMAGRLPLLHLKEYGISGNDRVMRPIGEGNLDWKSIISAGEQGGVEYFIVEQDDCNGMCPFEALTRSYRYISENFFV